VNLGKLAKRLKKELAANPKQAAVLGIGCVVAVWFWTPLVMRWWKPKATPKPAVAEMVATTTNTTPQPTTLAQAPVIGWREVRNWRKADPLMRSPLAVSERDPFAVRKERQAAAVAVAETTELTEETTEPEVASPREDITFSPEQLGLKVESIAYSRSRRRVQISGQTFQEQDDIALGGNIGAGTNMDSRPTCRVKAIEPGYVLVDFQGQELRLELQRKSLAPGDLVERR
jgi:hypothetical protein